MTKVFSVIFAIILTVALIVNGLLIHTTKVARDSAERIAYAFIIK